MLMKALFTTTALLSVVVSSPALAGTIFPPDSVSTCAASGAGMLSWDGNSQNNVKCKTIPSGSCPTGQVVLSTPTGLVCGSPIGACSKNQLLTAKNVGSAVVFSCEDVLSRITFSCSDNEVLKGITNGVPNCVPQGTTTSTPTASTDGSCGTHASGTTWTESCPTGQTGSITKLCSNGTANTTSNTCSAVVSTQIRSCVNSVCTGTGPVVMFPVQNATGAHNRMPATCSGGSWRVDTSGTNWSGGTLGQPSSSCSGGTWVFAGNCSRPDGGTFANCPAADVPPLSTGSCVAKSCFGTNTRLNPVRNASGRGFTQLRCPGYWWLDMRGTNFDSFCDAPGGTYGTGWIVETP